MGWRKAQRDETFSISEDLMSMHGVLYKKGRNLVKKYKKRWFVLSDNSLLLQYFSSPQQGKLVGQIDINYVLNVQPLQHNPHNKKHVYGMHITTSSSLYALYARTIEERDGWCNCINNRLRLIAQSKVSIREAQSIEEDDPERNQTIPHGHRHSNSHLRDLNRVSPRRALSDGMLRSRFTPPSLASSGMESSANSSPDKADNQSLKAETSITLVGTPATDYFRTNSLHSVHSHHSQHSLHSQHSPRARSPISISDEMTKRFNLKHDPSTVVHNSTFDDDSSMVNSPDSSTALDDPLAHQNSQLLSKLNRLEHIVAEKDATIAALSAMLKRQSMTPDSVRYSGGSVTPPPSVGKKGGVQHHLDEYVGMTMWLEQRKKYELEKDVLQLKETNEELGSLLEEERQKSQYLEREKYNMQCMIEHLEREKVKT